jgi:two-component system sensor histidine kinase BaeS
MLRSLGSRLVAAFLAVSIVVLVAAGGALFVVLRNLHADATTASLEDLAGSVIPQVRDAIGTGDLRGTIADVRDTLAARDIEVMVVGPDGRLAPLGGLPVGSPILTTDLAAGATAHGRADLDGTSYLWVAAGIRRLAAAAPRELAFVMEDRSAALALGDVAGAFPAVLVVTLLVAGPLAWLLARGVARPLRRVADAARALPSEGHRALPLEGPSEVQELTGTFNAMAAELDDTRRRESELLANMRHDIRTPLTVISGFATALRDGTASGDAATAATRAIEEESARLERLIAELGDVERLRGGDGGLRPEALDAVVLAESTVERFRERAARAGVAIVLDPPPIGFDPSFFADHVAVERMLGNLVGNALAALGSEGHIDLELADAEVGGRPAIAIDVVDDGPGFSPGTEGRAFERFWRADPSRVGTGSGLGLAIVRELARAHGGDARAANVRPHGARVGVVLPRSPDLRA